MPADTATLNGMHIVVLGGTSGLGAICTQHLLKSGACVLATGRNPEKAGFATTWLDTLSLLRFGYPEQPMRGVAAAAKETFGGQIQGLIHCFGPVLAKHIDETSPAELTLLLHANTIAFHEAVQEFAPLLENNQGRVIAFSAVGADTLTSKQMLPAYFAAKSAQLSLVRSWARQLAPRGITVNAIGLGAFSGEVKVEMSRIPMGRQGQAEDIGMALNYLLSEGAGYVTGAFIPVSGGYSV
jgi:NAD(P)-dependent dehydrogenase (short-subunit alcohol dehydrogenase family)